MKLTRLDGPGISIRFTVPGQPQGYVRRTRRNLWTPRVKSYHAWMQSVQVYARKAGLLLPLEATKDTQIRISIFCLFARKRIPPDVDGVLKAVQDALFYKSKSGDRYVTGCSEAIWDSEVGQVTIVVERLG